MAIKKSKPTRAQTETKPPSGLVRFLGLFSTVGGLPGRIRMPDASELEELNKVVESINAGPKGPPVSQQFWTDDAQVDCALAAATFVGAGLALAAGNIPVAAGLAGLAAKAFADAVKGINGDTKAGCGIETLEQMASLEAKVLKGATNSISLSGLLAARNAIIQMALQPGKSQRSKSPRGKSPRGKSPRAKSPRGKSLRDKSAK